MTHYEGSGFSTLRRSADWIQYYSILLDLRLNLDFTTTAYWYCLSGQLCLWCVESGVRWAQHG